MINLQKQERIYKTIEQIKLIVIFNNVKHILLYS